MSNIIKLFEDRIEEVNIKKNFEKERLIKSYKIINDLFNNEVKINYINDEIVDILSSINLDENNYDVEIEKLKVINWEEFKKLEKFKIKKPKIYNNFVLFVKKELGLIEKIENSLFNKREKFNIELKNKEVAKKFNVDIVFDYNKEPKKLSVNDFILYFNRRLDYFYGLLKNRVNIERVIKISKLVDFPKNEVVDIIGLVNEIRETKKGYILEIQDKTGGIKCFVNKENQELMNIISNLCYDEGVAIKGRNGDNIIWVEDIIIPTLSNFQENKFYDKDVYSIFISDTHFGSKVFIDDAFQKFLDFLNSNTNDEKLNLIAKKVKYVFIAGDVIEGIGIYPDQGKDVRIMSTELQYHEAARWLSQIPEDKCIIIIPGNHDTCRLSEPQLKISYDKAYPIYNMPNTIILSNPSIVNILRNETFPGFEIYLYHGGSLFYYGSENQKLREKGGVKNPNEVVKFLLEKRHLAPSHGSTLYYPDLESDPLVIKKLPDFFVLGHTHKLDVSKYKNTFIFSCGCWVEMSDYQEKQGMYPDPARAILVNLKTKKVNILKFR